MLCLNQVRKLRCDTAVYDFRWGHDRPVSRGPVGTLAGDQYGQPEDRRHGRRDEVQESLAMVRDTRLLRAETAQNSRCTPTLPAGDDRNNVEGRSIDHQGKGRKARAADRTGSSARLHAMSCRRHTDMDR
jgi:hypothetical protein